MIDTLAACPGCDLSHNANLDMLELPVTLATLTSLKTRTMAQSNKRQARMEGVLRWMTVLAFCAKFHECLSTCATASAPQSHQHL